MLKVIHSLREMQYSELMAVYHEFLSITAQDWSGISPDHGLQLAEQDLWQYMDQVFFKTKGAVAVVWLRDGHYASILRLEPYRDGLLLSALETIPQYRRQGCAESLIRGVIAHLKESGENRIYSHVANKNKASLSLHLKCGFQKISDCAVYLDGSVDPRSSTFYLTV